MGAFTEFPFPMPPLVKQAVCDGDSAGPGWLERLSSKIRGKGKETRVNSHLACGAGGPSWRGRTWMIQRTGRRGCR